MLKRGDKVSFYYLPSRLPEKQLWGHSLIKRVIRERQVAVVTVWNGSVQVPVAEQYEDIEVPLANLHLYRRAPRKKKK